MKSPFIDAAFFLGVLATCVQAADFLIRPAQKQRIQLFAEAATLHLEEIRPLEWLKFFRTAKARQLLYLTIVCGYQLRSVYHGWESRQVLTHDQMVVGPALFLLGLPLLALSFWYGPILVGWLYSDGKLTRFLERWLLLIYTTFFGILLGIAGLLYAFHKTSEPQLDTERAFHDLATSFPSLMMMASICMVYVLMALFSETSLLSTVGAVIVAAYIFAFILELGLKILRAFAWRVVEYNKGASPAILLILTSILGLWKLYLDHH